MYSVSQNFITAIKQPSRTLKCKVLVGDVELTERSVVNFVVENKLSSEGIPSIGSTISSTLKLKLLLDEFTPSYFTTQLVKPSIGVEVSAGVYEYIPLGIFKLNSDSVVRTKNDVTIDCFDEFAFLDSFQYNSNLEYPTSVISVLTEIQTNTGVTFKNLGSLPNMLVQVKPTGSVRKVIGNMAELLTSNAIINREGLIEFRMLTDRTFTLDANNYSSFKLTSDSIVNITQIEAVQRDAENQDIASLFSGTTTGATLKLDNPSINSQVVLDEIYARGYPISYYPYELALQGMPHMDCGDKFTLTDVSNVVRTIPIVSHTLTFNGGLTSKFSANCPRGSEVSSGSTGATSITESVNNINAKIYSVEHLLAGNIDADNIKSNSITADNMKVGTITAESGIIANGAITNAMIGSGVIGSVQIADGSITDAKIVGVTANKITAGTIDASEITVVNLHADSITVGKINGVQIASDAITSDHIANGTIKAENIASGTITADQLMNGTITAQQIALGAIASNRLNLSNHMLY